RTVAVVDAGAPRNGPAAEMHGFLSRDGMPPAELLAAGRAEVAGYGGTFVSDSVTAIEPGFRARLANGGELRARRILVATGLRDEVPDIPGVHERWGRDVLHCPYCHGYEVRDQPLAVLGGSREAVQHAVLIRQWSADILLFPHTDTLDSDQRELLAARGVQVIDGGVARLTVDHDRLHGVELTDGTLVPRSAVFVRPRFVPNSGLLTALGCEADENGWVISDAAGRTTVSGVRVAGNAADPRAQVITAAGQGSAAAIAINAELVDEDVNEALAAHRAAR
ncbi:MAG: NAD(P)/FAD-dependent oxidoreductase, partial [Actinomycetota bacterium]|nr:NAD(P)/FAD-dependent oxidoreductase [Actinomycetota bacterium]